MSEPSDWRRRRLAEKAARGVTAEQEAAEIARLQADAKQWHETLQWARRLLAAVDEGRIRLDNVPPPADRVVRAFERAARIFMIELDGASKAEHELFTDTYRDLVEPLMGEVLTERKAKRERSSRGGKADREPTSPATRLVLAVFAERKRLRQQPFATFVDALQPAVRFGAFEIDASTLRRKRVVVVERGRKRTRTRWDGDVTLTTQQAGSCVVPARALQEAWSRVRKGSAKS